MSSSRPKTGLVILSATLALGTAACSSSSNASAPLPTTTVMVTVKRTPTATAPDTSTQSSDSTGSTTNSPTTTPSSSTRSPTSAPTPTTPKGPPPTPGGQFDASWAKQAVGIILGDLKTIDGLSPQDASIGADYSNLSSAYGYLEQAGVPKGADGNTYLGGLETMIGLAFDASTAASSDPSGAHAKYLSARQKTQPVLDDINAAIGTHYTVPAAPGA